MADSSIEITAGSGTAIDTRTEGTNNNHRQVVVLGDPDTNAAVADVGNTEPALTDYGVFVKPIARGLTISRNLDVDESGDNQKNAAGVLFALIATNAHATDTRYLKIYNKATAPVVGTDTPVITIPLFAKSTIPFAWEGGVTFTAGIGVGATTAIADNDTGAPGANEVVITLFYK